MALHNDFGKKGEELASGWLILKGFTILHRNWRHGRYEVDIIAFHEGLLHFIEVKSRSSTGYGHPEEAVGKKKIKTLMKAILAYRYQFPDHGRVQLDILSVTMRRDAGPEYFLITDVHI